MSILLPNDVSQQMLDSKKTKNAKVTNSNGTCSFGVMPNLGARFPTGNIILKLGDSGFYDRNERKLKAAFGLRHIWDKHKVEIGATNAFDVIEFIESVITVGAEIIIDQNKDPNKPLIVESTAGMVVVELKQPQGEEPYYSIVTAYDKTRHAGTLVGNL
ncbi:hypothetical protein [Moritella viscosa]|uniref:Uncharacterized protein n=1 Tax=Moritella viscosa TaxID=80854 RepID=A0A1K9ZYI1_9GAMM|nr:hypothetical protein [Moritella viscosa]SGZ02311.1 Putative uncharacterized protein [Moritella viscosa]SGZ15295.1 Putative uncharacterized protein [Moritella viscosa]SGZ19886.1 Putative uncharacterized protein [Moritella viscosa]SHO28097.1 Putative uncharacterized protein [Moritella viscosa]